MVTPQTDTDDTIEVSGYVYGADKDIEIHLVWFYIANSGFQWRSYSQLFHINCKKSEDMKNVILLDPRNTFDLLYFVDVQTREDPIHLHKVHIKDKCYTLMLETDNYITSNTFRSFLFEHNTDKCDCNNQDEYFINDMKSSGSLTYTKENCDFNSQYTIPNDIFLSYPFRFQIISPDFVELKDVGYETVNIKLKVLNMTKNVIKDISVSHVDFQETGSTNAIWIGKEEFTCEKIDSGQSMEFDFQLLVMRPGIINIATFQVRYGNYFLFLPFSQFISVVNAQE
ncbi:hypothetical protein GPJ56_008694 [Histomonas meleagridis]|uniref:uncharacterized protein n=1 Tax=Histomonas meleagridis TaxID=135588 RepID=UPI00355A3621|nr:hypothetical protein GPJ56_008694 [Histomonas meleagridis]KAH0805727.1 hypothetical protein GO595_001366 [Histomonas meleagridis]